jgi:hypothetical protein
MGLFSKGLFFLLCFISTGSFAQKASERISGFYPGITFERFIEKMEEETSFRFFYKKADIEGLRVNLQANNDKLYSGRSSCSQTLNSQFRGQVKFTSARGQSYRLTFRNHFSAKLQVIHPKDLPDQRMNLSETGGT